MPWTNYPSGEYPRWMGNAVTPATPPPHRAVYHRWPLQWLPPRCSCGVWRYDRCQDRTGGRL